MGSLTAWGSSPPAAQGERSSDRAFSLLSFFLFSAAVVVTALKCLTLYRDPVRGVLETLTPALWHVPLLLLVSALLWRFVLRRRASAAAFCFSLLLLLDVSFSTYRARRQKEQLQAAATEMRVMLEALSEDRPPKVKVFDAARYGELTPMLQWMQGFFLDIRRDVLQMGKELDEIHREQDFSPEAFRSPERIEASRQRLQRFRDVLDRSAGVLQKRFSDAREKLQRSELSAYAKRRALEGMEGALGKSQPVFGDIKPLLDEQERLFQFMRAQTGRFQVTRDGIVFLDEQTGDLYDRHVVRIGQLADALKATMAAKKRSLARGAREIEQIAR
jgi:hypothetical protein